MLELAEEVGITYREFKALIALMHHNVCENREVGVSKGGYIMTSTDTAKYAWLASPCVARQAVMGLKKKGVIEVSRVVVKSKMKLTVYRLTEHAYEMCVNHDADEDDSMCEEEHAEGTRHEDATPTCYVSGTPCVTSVEHTPTSTHQEAPTKNDSHGLPPEKNILINTTTENRSAFQHSRSENCKEKIENDRFVTPRYPYPQSAEEVVEYAQEHWEEPGMEDLATLLVTEQPAIDFFNSNSRKNWTLPDGQRIYDWHSMLLGLGKRIMRDSERQGERFRRRTATYS